MYQNMLSGITLLRSPIGAIDYAVVALDDCILTSALRKRRTPGIFLT